MSEKIIEEALFGSAAVNIGHCLPPTAGHYSRILPTQRPP